MEQLLPRFRAAHTQVLGISVDSVFSHANWGQSLGGVSFPLLADFHPKGEVAKAFGMYLDGAGLTDRATAIIDAKGVVRHASSVTPSGRRDIAGLAGLCELIDAEHGAGLPDFPAPQGLDGSETLFIKSDCGFSRKVALARANLHLDDKLPMHNVTDDASARDELVKLAGKDQSPCLMAGGVAIQDSDDIVTYLVQRMTDLETAPVGESA